MPADSLPLAGKRAVVTGGAGGIGTSICEELLSMGAEVLIVDRQGPREGRVSGAAGENCRFLAVDLEGDYLADPRLREELRGADILVNAAGILYTTRYDAITSTEWQKTFRIGVDSYFFLAQVALVGMVERGWGRIVNLSSTAGKSVSTLGGVHYTASKAAVLGITRGLALEVASSGVTVNAVCPGLFETGMTTTVSDVAELHRIAEGFPVPRLGDVSEVAHAVGFLCHPRAAYVTGAALDVNGGDLMV